MTARDLLVAALHETYHTPHPAGDCIDPYPAQLVQAILATPSGQSLVARIGALEAALGDMISLARHGAARDHLDEAGIMQDPPHGMGVVADCMAPWCVRNRDRIGIARAALAPQEPGQ